VKTETSPFDVADYLDSPEMIAAYLEAAFEDNDPAAIALALGNVARAKGMSEVAKQAGVTRVALYQSLTAQGDPRLSTLVGVMKALGLRLVAAPAA
jgi:probable addiction module antidote protein